MMPSEEPTTRLLKARFDLCRRISDANARRFLHQRESFGADLARLGRDGLGSPGGSAEQDAGWAQADHDHAAAVAAMAVIDSDIERLEAELAAIDARIGAASKGA
jgi:hypothetical protein